MPEYSLPYPKHVEYTDKINKLCCGSQQEVRMSVFGITNHNRTNSTKIDGSECGGKKQKSSIYDCTVEDVEYVI